VSRRPGVARFDPASNATIDRGGRSSKV